MIKKTFVLFFCFCFLLGWSYAQEGDDPFNQPMVDSAEVTMINEEPLIIEEELCDGCVSFDFQGADIRNVLQILSYKSGFNIVIDPEVTGVVTIQLTNVPWEDALNVILNTYGYGYEKRGNILTITTIEKLKISRQNALSLAEQEPIQTKAFVLNYAKASEALASIEKMLTPRGSLNFDQRTNAIIIRDPAGNIEQISGVIEKLDAPTQQVLIEAKIIKTSLGDDEKLGINWGLGVTAAGAARPTYFPFTQSTSNKYSQGLDFDPDDATFKFGTLDFSGVQAILDILKTRSNTEILSNPRIVTLNNQKARISVGEQYPFPQYNYNEESDKLQISGYEYKDIGVIFEVTPYVNNVGMITLYVEPKVTARGDSAAVEGGIDLPVLSVEEASTRVMIQDGQTLVIAGLIKDQAVKIRKKVPILGSIPLLGLIFQKKETELTKTELLIFITPSILTEKIPDDSDLLVEKTKNLKIK